MFHSHYLAVMLAVVPLQAQSAATISVTSSANPSVYGSPLAFTVTVSGTPAPSGWVTATLADSDILGKQELNDGRTVFTATRANLSAGANSIRFSYSDSQATFIQWIEKANTVTRSTVSGTTLAATVAIQESQVGTQGSRYPTGTVQFFDGRTLLGKAELGPNALFTSTATLAVSTRPEALRVAYDGDANFTGSASDIALLTGTAAVTVNISSSANPSVFAMPVKLAVSVAPAATWGPIPTGTVSANILGLFALGGATLDAAGKATIEVPRDVGLLAIVPYGIGAGSNSLTVSYGGDNFYGPGQGSFTQVVNKADTVTTAAILPTASVGASISATVAIKEPSVTPRAFLVPGTDSSTPSGTVQFLDSGVVIGKATLNPSGHLQSTATLNLLGLPTETAGIVAVFAGDANYNGSTSPPVGGGSRIATTVAVTSDANPSSFAQPLKFAVAVASPVAINATPSGLVHANLGSYVLGSSSLDLAGRATIVMPQDPGLLAYVPWGLGAGSNAITFSYDGDATFGSSRSIYNQRVTKADTATSVSLPPIAFGLPFTAIATVKISQNEVSRVTFGVPGSPGSSPTGSVAFFNGGTLLGTVALLPGTPFFSTATFHSDLFPGSIRAVYYGDSNYNGSSSPGSGAGNAPVSITLASSSNPALYGAAFTIAATVTPQVAGGPTPTGTLSFYEGSRDLGWVATLDSTGRGTLPIPEPLAHSAICPCPSASPVMVLSAGSHLITVKYSGDSNYGGASSTSPLAQQITKAPTQTALSMAGTASIPSSLAWIAEVADAQPPGGGPYHFFVMGASGLTEGNPTGTVQFSSGSTILANVALQPSITGNVTSNATLILGREPVGNFSAAYSGDANFEGSRSAGSGRLTTSVTLTSNLNPSKVAEVVTLSAAVAPSAAGSVDFMDGATLLGRSTVSAGGAVISLSFNAASQHILTAIYSGDSNYLSATSVPYVQAVLPQGTAHGVLGLTSSLASAVFGQPITLTAMVEGNIAAPATGTILFLDGGRLIGSATISSNSARAAVTLPVGTHQISAAWGGDSNWPAATSMVLIQRVDRAQTLTTLTPAYEMTVTALPPGAGTPTGTVKLMELGSQSVLATATLEDGKAQVVFIMDPLILLQGHGSIAAVYGGDQNFAPSTSRVLPVITNVGNIAALTYAADEIVTVYGSELAPSTAAASLPLPTSLGETSVTVKDSAGVSRLAPLYYASPTQINLVIPTATALGPATVRVSGLEIPIMVVRVAPSLFNAAQIVRLHPDGTQSLETVTGPVAIGPDALYLVLYGSGLRNRDSQSPVLLVDGDVKLQATFVGSQSQYPGLDQAVVPLAPALHGPATYHFALNIEGQLSNTLTLRFE